MAKSYITAAARDTGAAAELAASHNEEKYVGHKFIMAVTVLNS